jgi:hypothetical protein
MISIDQKEKFIELRAKGLSYDKISKQMKVSKPTLIKWNTEFQKEISNVQFLEIQSVLELYKVNSKEKIEILTLKLQEVYKRLKKYEVVHLSLKDLLQLKDYLEKQLESENDKIRYYTGEQKQIDLLDLNFFNKTEEVTLKLE